MNLKDITDYKIYIGLDLTRREMKTQAKIRKIAKDETEKANATKTEYMKLRINGEWNRKGTVISNTLITNNVVLNINNT